MNPKPQDPSIEPGDLNERDLLILIAEALEGLALDLATERDKRIYLAFLAARIGDGDDGDLKRRFENLRGELGL